MSRTCRGRGNSSGPEGFLEILGYSAISFAAPGWQCTPTALDALVAEHFYYLSNTRGYAPYFPKTPDRAWPVLEIPTTLPTMDELLGLDGRSPAEVNQEILAGCETWTGPMCLPFMPRSRAGCAVREFPICLHQMQDQGISFIRLLDYSQELWQ